MAPVKFSSAGKGKEQSSRQENCQLHLLNEYEFASFVGYFSTPPKGSGSGGSKINPLDDSKIAKDVVTDTDAVLCIKT